MDQINISSWNVEYSQEEEIIYFQLEFENFAYISAASQSDQVRIDFLNPAIFTAKSSGVILKDYNSNLGNRIVK